MFNIFAALDNVKFLSFSPSASEVRSPSINLSSVVQFLRTIRGYSLAFMFYQIDVDVILISNAVAKLWKYLSFLIPEFGQTKI